MCVYACCVQCVCIHVYRHVVSNVYVGMLCKTCVYTYVCVNVCMHVVYNVCVGMSCICWCLG